MRPARFSLAPQGASSLGTVPPEVPVYLCGIILIVELAGAIWHESAMQKRFKLNVSGQLVPRHGVRAHSNEDKAPTP